MVAIYEDDGFLGPLVFDVLVIGFQKKEIEYIVLNSLTRSICRSYHEKSIASHQHSEIKPHWAPIVLRLVIT